MSENTHSNGFSWHIVLILFGVLRAHSINEVQEASHSKAHSLLLSEVYDGLEVARVLVWLQLNRSHDTFRQVLLKLFLRDKFEFGLTSLLFLRQFGRVHFYVTVSTFLLPVQMERVRK